MKKRGLIFIIDVVLGFSILIAGILLIFSFVYENPQFEQIETYSVDASSFILTTQFGQISNQVIVEMLRNKTVQEKTLLSEHFTLLCKNNTQKNNETFRKIVLETLEGAIPKSLGFSIIVYNESSSCLNYTRPSPLNPPSEETQIFLSTKNIILARYNETLIGPYILEATVS